MAEWSKAPDSSFIASVVNICWENSGPQMWAWVQIPLLTSILSILFLKTTKKTFICRELNPHPRHAKHLRYPQRHCCSEFLLKKIVSNQKRYFEYCNKIIIASAGNRTPINCLEGNYANHYTTDACGVRGSGNAITSILPSHKLICILPCFLGFSLSSM